MRFRQRASQLSAFAGLVGIMGASLSGCNSGSSTATVSRTPDPIGNVDFTTRAACRANPAVAGRAKWTVLIYMNAANNLQPDSLSNIAQIANVGSDANVNVVVQWKQANCVDCGIPSFTETRRYRITKHTTAEVAQIQNGNTTVLDRDILAPPAQPLYNPATKQTDMGDVRVLQDFVRWGAVNYPADHLAVFVWNHGSGWRPSRAANRLKPRFRAVSQDNETRNEIQTEQLPSALGGLAKPIDLLAFDASLEMMAEVAYEVRNVARVMIGSEESPPGAGYPYDLWLTDLKAAAGANPCLAGSSMVTRFVNFYTANRPDFTNITQSMIDLSKMQSVAQALDSFGLVLRQNSLRETNTIQGARLNVQNYTYSENKDLFHYAEIFIRGFRDNAQNINIPAATTPAVVQAAQNLQSALRGATNGAVMSNGRGLTGQPNSNGMAIYVPRAADYLPAYNNIAISQQGGAPNWALFLQQQPQ